MSQLIKINGETFFITITSKDDPPTLELALTDFQLAYKSSISKADAVEEAKAMNPSIEIEDEKIFDIIRNPSEMVELINNTLKFKYKISGFPFRFNWTLQSQDSSSVTFILLDALLRLKNQIDEFRRLPDSDPALLDRLPMYESFDVASMIMDDKIFDELKMKCATTVKISSVRNGSGISPAQMGGLKNTQNKSPTGKRGTKKYQAAKRNIFGNQCRPLDNGSISSQEDTPPILPPTQPEPSSKRAKSNEICNPKTRLRNKLNL